MTVPAINLNVCDADGMTPIDILKQRPDSATSRILIKQLVSAGGVSNKACGSFSPNMKMQGIGGSPGTSFRIRDSEIFLSTGIENLSVSSSDLGSPYLSDKKADNVSYYDTGRLKPLLQWRRKKERRASSRPESGDDVSVGKKRIFSKLPSALTKKKYTSEVLTQGVIQAGPALVFQMGSPWSPGSGSWVCSTSGNGMDNKHKGSSSSSSSVGFDHQSSSLNKKVMNEYLCYGAQGVVVED
ncbi:hypothetical protein ACFE04_028104 [Oxalis oulophora]